MTKRRSSAADATSEAGSTSSADKPRPARPWTDEEMAAAKPLPLPTVDPTAPVGTGGVSHSGRGETRAAGRPENEEAGPGH
jgi:hypothetical protein